MDLKLLLRKAAAVGRNDDIVQYFEIAVMERMIEQFGQMAENGRHSLSAGS